MQTLHQQIAEDFALLDLRDAEEELALAKERRAALGWNSTRQQRAWAKARVRDAERNLTKCEHHYWELTR